MSVIPHIPQQAMLEPVYQEFLQALQMAGFSGDIETSYATRLTLATDNSVYQQLPQGAVFPRSITDIQLVAKTACQPGFDSIRFGPRGGGTGTNGQSLTPGLVVDLSRYMSRVLAVEPESSQVQVEAGLVKDALNDALRPHNHFFAPELSTSNRATIGGMINTDASGQGSLVYGKTSDHLLAVKAVLADGTLIETRPVPLAEARTLAQGEGSEAALYAQVIASCEQKRELIDARFPKLNRFLTGYDLKHAIDWGTETVDLARLIAGSEGSLAFVCEATLNITELPNYRTLVNVKYSNFEAALRNAPAMVEANATSVETVDSRVLNLAREDVVWHSVSDLITDVEGQDMQGLNMVEFADQDEALHQQKVNALCERLEHYIENGNEAGVIGYQLTHDIPSITRVYGMRKKAVGLLGNTKGSKKPIAFAEDTCVPPENLADFIMEFRALLDSYQLQYGMFGHVDAGVLHVRPAMDLCDPEQEVLLRKISDQVVALTAKYGGLMWGEHGKGYRSEYGPEFFGEELFAELQKIKSAFDPNNRMNPGKICTPYGSVEQLVSVDAKKRGAYDRQIPVNVRNSFTESVDCNGNGLCFNYDVSSPMCPSFKMTNDRRHSPKGRAAIMREWLRQVADLGVDPTAIEQESQTLAERAKATIAKWKNTYFDSAYDYNHEVMEAMKGCLACKACTTACPIKVDVPNFRARFMNLYYQRYQRPLRDYVVGTSELYTPLMAKFPKLSNALVGNAFSGWMAKQTIGMEDLPLLSTPTLKQRLYSHPALGFELDEIKALSPELRKELVLIVQDPFTSYYDAQVVEALVRFLSAMGKQPVLLPFKPNGKPQHIKGFLNAFAKTAQNAADFLNELHALDLPMLGLDPALVMTYRDEYKLALGDKRGEFNVQLLQEWLLPQLADLPKRKLSSKAYTLFAHCTEKSYLPSTHTDWQTIFSHFGGTLTPQPVGCCGMAGTYGHETPNQENSKGIYQLSWAEPMAKTKQEEVLSTGYSCRSQVKRIEGFKPKHPVEALLELVEL